MLEGKPAIGAASGLGAPLGAEILSQAGYDFVLVDNQHGAWDEGSTLNAVRSICLGPAAPMARVRQNDYAAIGRLLDMGMLGIVVPMVNSVEDARAAAHAVRYPPRGGRSAGPFGARFYGGDYSREIDDEVFLAVQIETAQAVGCAKDILAVEGVDGCWVGPGDLANTMGVDLGTLEGQQAHEAAIMSVLEACRRAGKIPGIAGGNRATYWLERGFLFVTSVSDMGLVVSGAGAFLEKLGEY
jgi:4-hydroxy-2-oxoheptanedioate aldolase